MHKLPGFQGVHMAMVGLFRPWYSWHTLALGTVLSVSSRQNGSESPRAADAAGGDQKHVQTIQYMSLTTRVAGHSYTSLASAGA